MSYTIITTANLIDLSTPAALKVLWAAMCSMTQDIHSPQDSLSEEEWEVADRVFAQLDEVQNAKP